MSSSILLNAVPSPNLTAEEVAKLLEAADHLEAADRALAGLEKSLEEAEKLEEAWLTENLADGERNALVEDEDYRDIGSITYYWHDAKPGRLASDLRKVAWRCRSR